MTARLNGRQRLQALCSAPWSSDVEPSTSFQVNAFTVWAAVVALIGTAIVYELTRLRGDVKTMSKLLYDHILFTERRNTHTETFLSIKYEDYQPLTKPD